MKNSSPYAKDKLVHQLCAEGWETYVTIIATVDREDILFTLRFVVCILLIYCV